MKPWIAGLSLFLSVACYGQTADRPPYLNPDLAAEKRAADLVSRMTLEEKVLQMQNGAPAHPAPQHSGLRLVERSPARRGARRAGHRLSAGHRPGRHLRYRPDAPHRRRHLHRSPRQVQRGHSQRQSRPLFRPHLLVAQHQHLSRSALGPRPGDLRRRSVPHRPHGRRLHPGNAGRRSALLQGDRHRQALRRAQRTRVHRATSSTCIPASAT